MKYLINGVILVGVVVIGIIAGMHTEQQSLLAQIKNCPAEQVVEPGSRVTKRIVVNYDDPPTRFSQVRVTCDS